MKCPESVPADLFKRAETLKAHNEHELALRSLTLESLAAAPADRWLLLEIIQGLEEQRDAAKAAGFDEGYEQRYDDMVGDGWVGPGE